MLYSNKTGSGEYYIIFVHGNSQSHQVWDRVTGSSKLNNYTCVAVDLPGHGQSFRSTQPEKDYTLAGMAGHLLDFTTQFKNVNYLLVGSSLGTNYIGEIAGDVKNCKGFFLTGPCLIGIGLTPADFVLPNPNFPPTFAASPTDEELTALMNDEAYHVPPQLLAQLKKLYLQTDPNLRVTLGASIAQQGYTDEINNIKQCKIPTALVYGADDKLIYTDYLHTQGIKMWQNQIIKIPKAGHCCQFDEPELLAQLIADFAEECFK